jgi:hypothetical protein
MKHNKPFFNIPQKNYKSYLMTFVFTLICTIAFLIQNQHLETRIPDSTTPIELYSNQTNSDLRMAFSDAIDSAKHSILLIIYSLTDPTIIEHLKFQS